MQERRRERERDRGKERQRKRKKSMFSIDHFSMVLVPVSVDHLFMVFSLEITSFVLSGHEW